MAHISHLWRYPIKSHGREALDRVMLGVDRTMPGDRVWAVAHAAAKADGSDWVPCSNFSRGAKAPELMAMTAQYDDAAGRVTLIHPRIGSFTFDPDGDSAAFLDWSAPLMPADRTPSARVIRVPGRGMTDTPFPSISLIGQASLDALSEHMGQPMEQERFRANIWMQDVAPFEEFNWVGRTIQIGGVQMKIEERITRCRATTANPQTGQRDADTLAALQSGWGHQELGVYGRVTQAGDIALGDNIEVL